MTHLKRSLLLLITLAGMLGIVACDNYDEMNFSYVDKTTITLESSTLHSLSFKWTTVDNVTTYKYVFLQGNVEDSKDDAIAEGTTTNNALVFENLTPGENYTLWITPVSDTGLISRSFYGTFATVSITPLDSPKVTCELDSATYNIDVKWTAVDDARDYTWYYLVDSDTISQTTEELEASFSAKNLSAGIHTVYVVANSAVEEHTNSLPGSARITLGEVSIAEKFVGKYTVYSEGMTCYNLSDWADFTETHTTTITKENDVTIKIANLFKGIGVTGYIDEASQTIQFPAAKSSKYNWYLYYFDESFSYQETTDTFTGYYEIEEDGTYTIYLYDENTTYGYVWAYGYPYSDGYFPYWVGMSVIYPVSE